MHSDQVHYCELPEDCGGLSKLPPNAPFRAKVSRSLRKLFTPNPNSAIAKRNFRNLSQIFSERRRQAQSKYYYVIHPYSDMEYYREVLFLIIGIYEIISNPLIASFGHVWNDDKKGYVYDSHIFTYPDLILMVAELVWIGSNFFAAYKEPRTKTIELNHWKIIKRYLLTYFVIDLMYISPPYVSGSILYWFNLSIFGRLGTIVRYTRRFLCDFGVPDSVITFVVFVGLSFFMIHLLTCIFYFLPFKYNRGLHELWLVKTKLHPHTALAKVYFSCFSMVQTHFWGLGEATMRVENLMENAILIIAMVVGRLWSLYLLATILRIFTVSSLSESKYEEYLMQLNTFIAQKHIPKELADRLLEYYRYKYQHHYFNEKAIFNAMSQYLKRELQLFSARNVINKVAIFKYFPRSMIASVIEKCKVMVFLNHDIVIHVGDLVNNVYFISSGTLAVYNKRGIELSHYSDGQEIGIRGVINSYDTYFEWTYIAIETTEMYIIPLKEFRNIIYNTSDILKYFSKRVEERAAEMEKFERMASTQGLDLLSELKAGKLLEHPRIRTRYFER